MVVVLPIFSPNEAIPWLRAPTILPGIAGERLLFLFLVSMKDDSRAGESVKLLQSTEDTEPLRPPAWLRNWTEKIQIDRKEAGAGVNSPD